MATYEYICEDGHISTEVRGMTEAQKITHCEKCPKEVRRHFSAVPVQFKGPGFYSTTNK